MSEIKTRYYQTCDFCHKEVETGKDGLLKIWLPGYLIDSNGTKVIQCIKGGICDNCTERLFHKLENFLSVREIEYGGTAIQWKEDMIND